MESVYVPDVTRYVIHVDGKETADATYERLVQYAQEKNEYAINVEGKEEYSDSTQSQTGTSELGWV